MTKAENAVNGGGGLWQYFFGDDEEELPEQPNKKNENAE